MTCGRSRRHKLAVLSVAWLALAMAGPAADAKSTGTALVVGIDPHAGPGMGPGAAAPCASAANTLGDRLRQQGFNVSTRIDPSLAAMHGAIDDFATEFDGTVSGPALIYVCAAAVIDGSRLFVMPATADADGITELETQSIIAQALLNALAGTNGTLYADLAVPPGAPAAAAIQALGRHLPKGLHLAIAAKGDAAPIGRGLAGASVDAGQDWDAVAIRLAAMPDAAAGSLVAYLPAPVAPPARPALQSSGASQASGASSIPGLSPARPAPPPALAAAAATPAAIRHPRRHALPAVSRQVPQPDGRIARLQHALSRLGYYHGPVDGALDEPTLASIRAFQHALGDPGTGMLDPAEIVRLLNT